MARGQPVTRLHDGFVPGRHLIDAYGNGGFRFGDMSHRGSILALPSGVHIWPVTDVAGLTVDAFDAVFAERENIETLLIGAGAEPIFLAEPLRWAFREAKIGVDVMTTGAAARTFNILLSENRAVAAALIAVA